VSQGFSALLLPQLLFSFLIPLFLPAVVDRWSWPAPPAVAIMGVLLRVSSGLCFGSHTITSARLGLAPHHGRGLNVSLTSSLPLAVGLSIVIALRSLLSLSLSVRA